MEVLWVAGGLAVVGAAVTDALWTALWPEGRGGPISSNLGRAVWHLMERVARGRPRLLSVTGPTVLVLSVVTWVALLVCGWTLVFTPEEAIRSTRDEAEDLAGRLWYVVSTAHTVGNGDYTPATNWSEIASALTAFTGMALITLSITYLLSVIRAVAQRRAFASHIASLGHRPERVVANAWDGSGFPGIDSILDTISDNLSVVEHQRSAFPSVQYFHPPDPRRSSEAMLVVLDEALTLWSWGVAQNARPAPAPLKSAQTAVRDYLQVLSDGPISPSDEEPPPPDLGELRAVGIPTVGDAEFAERLRELGEHRRLLLAVIHSDARSWHQPPAQ